MSIVLATPKLSDAATLSTTGTVASSLPLTNLQAMQPEACCRFTSLSGMEITADLGAAAAIDTVWLGYTNATSAATWRVRAASSQAGLTSSPGYDSGSVSVWPASGLDDWDKVGGLLWLSAAQTYRWWRIDIADAANPAGYFDIGRLYLADAWNAGGIMFGWSIGFLDDSPVERARGGQMHPSERPRRREAAFTLRGKSEADMYANAFALDQLRGRSKDVLAVRNPTQTTFLQHQTIYGLMTALRPIVNTTYNVFRKQYRIEELIP